MSELTTGYTALCDAPAGVDTLYVGSMADCSTGVSNVATFTHSAGEVTSFKLETGKQMFPFLVEQESVSATANQIGERTNKAIAFDLAVNARLHGNTAGMITMFEEVQAGRVFTIVKCNDGTNELFFHEKGAKVAINRTLEATFDGFNGNDMVMTGKQTSRPLKISDAIVAALLVPAV